MEFRPRKKHEILKEIYKICKEMFCVGIFILLLGVLGLAIFHYTGKYFIHPAIYLFLIAMGFFLDLVALCSAIGAKRTYGEKRDRTMSKTEAIVAMKEGKKVTHEFFGSNEFLFMDCGIIRTEEGYNFDDGWDERIGPEWEQGWRLYGNTQLCK